jgi:ubiquinone biosynthesis protein
MTTPMSARKHLRRYREIVGVLAGEGLDNALDITGLRRFAPVKGRLAARREGPTTLPVRIRRTLERLGPSFVKLGQAASTRSDIIPEPIILELQKLQDRVEPFAYEKARAIVERELGAPLEQLFASFDVEPLASASLGQVHAATLPDGTRVAVKVQRPDVREQVETDLDIVTTQARTFAGRPEFEERYDVVGIADEFARALHDELDYLTEARNAERLRSLFEGDDSVFFPRVHWEWTTTRVLTLDLVEGIPLNRSERLDEAGIDRAAVARAGIYCYLEQIFSHGFFHADPHPGNLFVLPDGRVGFTDFGRVGTISHVAREQLSDLLIAVVDNDAQLAVDMLYDAAGSPGDIDVSALQREVSQLLAKYCNRALTEMRVGELIREVLALVRNHHLAMSSELALLFATLTVLEGLGMQLDPGFDFVDVVTPFARRIVLERGDPHTVAHAVSVAFRRGGRLMTELPDSLLRVLKRAGQGEFRLTVRPTGFEPLMDRFERATNRVAFALVVSAFVVALALLLQGTGTPPWFVWVARILEFGGLTVASWFFISIFVASYRRR